MGRRGEEMGRREDKVANSVVNAGLFGHCNICITASGTTLAYKAVKGMS